MLNIFNCGASLERLPEPLADKLWRGLMTDVKNNPVSANGSIEGLYVKKYDEEQWAVVRERLMPIFDALNDDYFLSAQFKYYKRGVSMSLHRDVGYFDKIYMITLGGNKEYMFESGGEEQRVVVGHGDILKLEGDAIEKVFHELFAVA